MVEYGRNDSLWAWKLIYGNQRAGVLWLVAGHIWITQPKFKEFWWDIIVNLVTTHIWLNRIFIYLLISENYVKQLQISKFENPEKIDRSIFLFFAWNYDK
jgi:hypothetical protein